MRSTICSLAPELGDTNSACHGNTSGVSGHDKRIMSSAQVVVVLWDDFFVNTPGAQDQAVALLTDLVAGPFMNGLAQYGVGRGTVSAVTVSSSHNPPSKSTWDVSGKDDRDQLLAFLADNLVSPKPSVNETNLLYMMLLPRTLSLTNGKNPDGTVNTNVCGWHGHWKFNDHSDRDDLFWCVVRTDHASTATAKSFVQSVAFCVGHELAEAVSDRDPQGWHGDDGNGCEIGDLCEQLGTHDYRGWQVQQYWSQWAQTCINGEDPISLRTILEKLNLPGSLRSLGSPVVNTDVIAAKFR
jgi:hypothetical protein